MEDEWPVGAVISMGTLRVRVEGAVGSTHEELWSRRRWVEAGTGIAAESQSAGVGRSGARWASPPGGLYVSVVAGEGAPLADSDALGAAASLAALQMAQELVPEAELFLKWPNDVVVRLPKDRIGKVAGVIVRAESDSSRVLRAVVSVGANLSSAVETAQGLEGPMSPASLESVARRAGAKWEGTRAQGLEWLVGFLALDIARATVDPTGVRARYGAELRKSPLRARIAGVKEVFRPVGVVQGGALVVRRENGQKAEVSVDDAQRLEWKWLRQAAPRPKSRKVAKKKAKAKRAAPMRQKGRAPKRTGSRPGRGASRR